MTSEIREVPAFMTTDNKVHLSRAHAERHQAEINLLLLVEKHGYRGMDPDGIANMLSEHVADFLPLMVALSLPKKA
jgi:hypothetical protein